MATSFLEGSPTINNSIESGFPNILLPSNIGKRQEPFCAPVVQRAARHFQKPFKVGQIEIDIIFNLNILGCLYQSLDTYAARRDTRNRRFYLCCFLVIYFHGYQCFGC